MIRIFRIGDERYPIWDGTGAALIGGRWNSPGRPVIYGSLSYSTALLEVLVHANIGRIPDTQRLVIAEAHSTVSIEQFELAMLPSGWDSDQLGIARKLGDQWLTENRSAILLVPSIVARLDWNALVNPLHPEACLLKVAVPEKVLWDKRLFER